MRFNEFGVDLNPPLASPAEAYGQDEQSDAVPNPENGFKRNSNKAIESDLPADEKHLKQTRKEQDSNLDALVGNLLNDLLQQNKSLPVDERSLQQNQHLIWFLMAKIIPTTTKLNQFLCGANGSSSDQLCTSFNHLHLLVGKSKRSSSNDETFQRARLIEDLSNQFDDLNRRPYGQRLHEQRRGQVHGNLDKKFDIKLNHKFSNKFNHRNFAVAQHAFNHYDLNKRDFESLPPAFDVVAPEAGADFEADYETKRSLGNRYHLNRLMNSKSIYKHHQRLKRTVDTVLDQLASTNATLEQHRIGRRSVDNDIKYPDIQQFGE